MTSSERLERLLVRDELSPAEAREALDFLVSEESTDVERAALLVAWRAKGITGGELSGLMEAASAKMLAVELGREGLIDTCGTGGGPATLNLSTGAAIVAAAAGVYVAKHGNRSVSSRVGSADVIEAWGIPLDESTDQIKARFDRCGVTFLFAPSHHEAFRAVAPVRRALGIRTLFNLVGPLANPARASRRMIGVYSDAFLDPLADCLRRQNIEQAYVVYGQDGLDEVSPTAPTHYRHVRNGQIVMGTWEPADFGVRSVDPRLYEGSDTAEEAAMRLREAMQGGRGYEALIPNVAVALMLAGLEKTEKAAGDRARETLRSGRSEDVLARMRG